MKLLFWFSLIFIVYTYLGYPLILFIWSRLFPKGVNKKYIEPFVSVVVTAYNEEKNIKGRVENLLSQDYPHDKLEIIVVSDGSTNGTNDLINQLHNNLQPTTCNLQLITYTPRKGKPHALNLGVQEAKGEILVFTDARQQFEKNAIRELIANFSDPKVGCVSGELVFYEDSDSSIKTEMGTYWNYEKWIRKKEGEVGSVAGATGSIYAIRKELYRPLPDDILLDDVLIPMNIVLAGYRTVFDSKALAYDIVSKDMAQEKGRKIRTLAGNWQLIARYRTLLNPFKNPIFFQYISHKVLRLLVPFCLIGLFVAALFLRGVFYHLVLMTLILGIILPYFEGNITRLSILEKMSKLSRAFLSLNYFAFLGFFYFLKPRKNLW